MNCSAIIEALEQATVGNDPPWGLATTAAGVAILLVCIFLRFISSAADKTATEQKAMRDAHIAEMSEQRKMFAASLKEITETNAASAERVENALRDLAIELRSGNQPRPRVTT